MRFLSRNAILVTLLGMSATYNHRRGSTFAAAQRRSAESRQCPECQRKAALVKTEDGERECRWCGWATYLAAIDQEAT